MIEALDGSGQGEYTVNTGLTALRFDVGGDVFTLADDPAASVILDHENVVGLNFSAHSAAGWLHCTSTRLGATFFLNSRTTTAFGVVRSTTWAQATASVILSLQYALSALTVVGLAVAGVITRRKRTRFAFLPRKSLEVRSG